MKHNRNRLLYLILTFIIVLLGLASRRYSLYLPNWINSYLGDTLWALMVFFLFATVFNRLSTYRIIILALGFAYCIEISQLYHAPWIDEIRRTRLGGLVLGYGFLWPDILSYTIGVMFGAVVEKWLLPRTF